MVSSQSPLMSSFGLLLCLHTRYTLDYRVGCCFLCVFGGGKAEKELLLCLYWYWRLYTHSTHTHNQENVNFGTSTDHKKISLFSHNFHLCLCFLLHHIIYRARDSDQTFTVSLFLLLPIFSIYYKYFYTYSTYKTTVIIQESAVICVFLCQEEKFPAIMD